MSLRQAVTEGGPKRPRAPMFDRVKFGVRDFETSKAFFVRALAPLHIAFVAEDPAQVDACHRAAIEAGGVDNGPPGLRPHYHAHDYAGFVIGPDGHNLEAVCHTPTG